MQETYAKVLESKPTRVIYFAVLLLAVLLILGMMASATMKSSEHLIGVGSGLTEQSLFSGPTIRRLGQEFTSTNQGDSTTVYIPDVLETVPGVLTAPSSERLVNDREPPVFYDIGDELGAYQSDAGTAMKQDVAAGKTSSTEYLAAGSPASMYQEERLRRHLYQ